MKSRDSTRPPRVKSIWICLFKQYADQQQTSLADRLNTRNSAHHYKSRSFQSENCHDCNNLDEKPAINITDCVSPALHRNSKKIMFNSSVPRSSNIDGDTMLQPAHYAKHISLPALSSPHTLFRVTQ